MKKEIPIFFSTDDNYVPFLDIAIASLKANASKSRLYRIIVLNTGLSDENVNKIKQNEEDGFAIDFANISKNVENIKSSLKDVYHFSVATYYRLFIASLFPKYDKIIYLDCDLVVNGDISELYDIPLGDNILAAAPEQHVQNTPEFRRYTEIALGIDPDDYVNAGVLVINLKKFREHRIEEKFIELITKYNFDLLDPDQAYINYLCSEKIKMLPNGWNKEPLPLPCNGSKNIVHYALYKKPWQYDDVIDGEFFWSYAKKSPFFHEILTAKKAFGPSEMHKKAEAAKEILLHANAIVNSNYTFSNMLTRR